MDGKQAILEGKTALGIEFGSTRIKAVLIDETYTALASGSFEWENQLEQGIWTYSLDMIWEGLKKCYADMAEDVRRKYDVTISDIGSIGFSAMMHGYMPFDKEGRLLVPFRTWRNTMTEEAAAGLTEEFDFNIPQRWSIAHLYQAILKEEEHVKDIAFITTLAGYIHWQMTGEKVLGIGDASGMFPIDSKTGDYDVVMLSKFDALIQKKGYPWKIKDILPKVLKAGEKAGTLTEEAAKLLDVSGNLKPGIRVCPPEGDAGTGMVATNSVKVRTGNVSAGTSVFAMIVLEKVLKKVHPAIDLVTTPTGEAVAMVHCNNCTSDINAWTELFYDFLNSLGISMDKSKLFELLYGKAMEGNADCGGLLAYNYVSGESITGFEEGRPLFVRKPNSSFTLANFMRVHLFTALGALKNGLDILLKEEQVQVDKIYGHGGWFKTPAAGQRIMAAAMNTPVSVMESAGEGGAWGMAVLAAYLKDKKDTEGLAEYLNRYVFAKAASVTEKPMPEDVAGFEAFMKCYNEGLAIERAAVECF